MINVSEKAARQIKRLIEDEGDPNSLLRVKVKKGGCSGLSYVMEFTTEQQDNDKVFESNGAKIIVDTESLLYVLGMTLNYDGGLNGQGFEFSNPNAQKTCSCGSSFAV
ncbi:MAG: iron-sulfur cluster assembly accessory protein [Bdellovibrionales bacterium]|nr:iron-sulfur cluster assembly accessory protein [Bdellovibrionales bacterium]